MHSPRDHVCMFADASLMFSACNDDVERLLPSQQHPKYAEDLSDIVRASFLDGIPRMTSRFRIWNMFDLLKDVGDSTPTLVGM